MILSKDQRLWILAANPDTLQLMEDAPLWLIEECRALGVIEAAEGGQWKLTPAGYHERESLLA